VHRSRASCGINGVGWSRDRKGPALRQVGINLARTADHQIWFFPTSSRKKISFGLERRAKAIQPKKSAAAEKRQIFLARFKP